MFGVALLVFVLVVASAWAEGSAKTGPASPNLYQDVKNTTEQLAIRQLAMDSELNHMEATVQAMCTQMEFQLRAQALVTGPAHHIYDSALSASSSFDNRTDHGPQCSRLLIPKPPGCFSQAWLKADSDHFPWIQAYLDHTYEIYSVATQGRGDAADYVKTYKLALVMVTDVIYYGCNGEAKVFNGNIDAGSVVKNYLSPPLVGQHVRLYPLTASGGMALRWELYGYKPFC